MIVLRIEARGATSTVRTDGEVASVGAGADARIARDDVGWAACEGVLERDGTRLRLRGVDGVVRFDLADGERATLGDAVLTWLATEPAPAAPEVTAAPGTTTAPSPRRRSTFDDDLYATLRRAPWYALSVAVHVVLFGALLLFGPSPTKPRPARDAYGLVSATRPPDDPWESGGPETSAAKDTPPEESAAPAPEALAPEPEPEPSSTDVPAPVDPPDVAKAPPPPEPVGPDRGVIGLRRGDVRPPPPPTPPEPVPSPEPGPPPAVVLEPTVDEEYATETNRKAAARVKEALRDASGALGKVLRGTRSEDLLVVSNGRAFDHLENVLEAVSIPYVRVSVADFAAKADLARTRVVLWNCGPPIDDAATRALVTRKVGAFVAAGGFLWTTDWGLRDVVATAFPGRLATSEDRLRTLPELLVDVRAAAGAEADALLEGVMPAAGPCRWWLEAASAEVRVLDAKAVRVLLEAPALAGPAYRRSAVIAATFAAGRGRVLHVMGHAWQEKADVDGTVSMQRLALNFVRARLERDAAPDAPR